jgi:16S rRNA processing protein RimM
VSASASCSRSLNDARVAVGRVGRAHGLDGSFVVEGASEDEDRFAVGAELLAGGDVVRVVDRKRSGGRVVIRLDRPVARGTALEIRRADLPPAADDDSYYVFQLVGLAVEEEGGRPLGRVAEVVPAPANDVLELDTGLALPLVGACVTDVDLERGRIVVAPGFAEPE